MQDGLAYLARLVSQSCHQVLQPAITLLTPWKVLFSPVQQRRMTHHASPLPSSG